MRIIDRIAAICYLVLLLFKKNGPSFNQKTLLGYGYQ